MRLTFLIMTICSSIALLIGGKLLSLRQDRTEYEWNTAWDHIKAQSREVTISDVILNRTEVLTLRIPNNQHSQVLLKHGYSPVVVITLKPRLGSELVDPIVTGELTLLHFKPLVTVNDTVVIPEVSSGERHLLDTGPRSSNRTLSVSVAVALDDLVSVRLSAPHGENTTAGGILCEVDFKHSHNKGDSVGFQWSLRRMEIGVLNTLGYSLGALSLFILLHIVLVTQRRMCSVNPPREVRREKQ